MIINTEKDQRFLELVWDLQNNNSNAILTPYRTACKIVNKKVYRAYDFTKNERIYSLKPIQNITEENKPIPNLGGRPRSLTDKEKEEICRNVFHASKRELARTYNVSEGTIRNVLKERK